MPLHSCAIFASLKSSLTPEFTVEVKNIKGIRLYEMPFLIARFTDAIAQRQKRLARLFQRAPPHQPIQLLLKHFSRAWNLGEVTGYGNLLAVDS